MQKKIRLAHFPKANMQKKDKFFCATDIVLEGLSLWFVAQFCQNVIGKPFQFPGTVKILG